MKSALARYESLLSWIDPRSQDQASWISNYLHRKGHGSLLGSYSLLGSDPEKLVPELHAQLHDPASREIIRAMRGAWYVKKHRESNDRPVNFQLPGKIAEELNKIAKDREISRTQALKQVVTDTARETRKDRSKTLRTVKKLRENLKNLRQKKLESEGIRNRIINDLSELLIQEVISNCRFKATIGPIKDDELNEATEESTQGLLTERISIIDKELSRMRLLGSGVTSIREHLTQLVTK